MTSSNSIVLFHQMMMFASAINLTIAVFCLFRIKDKLFKIMFFNSLFQASVHYTSAIIYSYSPDRFIWKLASSFSPLAILLSCCGFYFFASALSGARNKSGNVFCVLVILFYSVATLFFPGLIDITGQHYGHFGVITFKSYFKPHETFFLSIISVLQIITIYQFAIGYRQQTKDARRYYLWILATYFFIMAIESYTLLPIFHIIKSTPIISPLSGLASIGYIIGITYYTRSLDHERTTLTGSMVHDIKNTLYAAYTGLKEASTHLTDYENEELHSANEGILRAVTMANNMLTIGQIEEGGLTLDREPVKVYELCTTVPQHYTMLIKSKHLLCTTNYCDIRAKMDRQLMERVLDNLYYNAFQHALPDSSIETTIATSGTRLQISIANNGPTVAPEMREKIFDKYVTTGKRSSLSKGMGLYFCKLVMQKHYGDIVYSVDEGGRNVFTLTI